MDKNKKIIFAVVGVVVLLGVFFIGMSYGKSETGTKEGGGFGANMQNQPNGQFGMNGKNNRNSGSGFVAGQIISKDDKSVTIKINNTDPTASDQGGSKIIFVDTNTTVSKMTDGSLNDLKAGEEVSVTGTTNGDGSIVAKSIQIRPQVTK